MFQIVEKELRLRFPRLRHLHVLSCQTPNALEKKNLVFRLADPDGSWNTVRSVLELAIEGRGNLDKNSFLFLPESSLPASRVNEALALVERLHPNTVTVIGIGPMTLGHYRDLLTRYSEDNREALESVLQDLACGETECLPVNACLVAAREDDGRLRVFFVAKSHPFVGEENLDCEHFLYRGKVFPLFRCQPSCFNFMVLICLDYAYRTLHRSNISVIIDRAKQLFLETRQKLDLLAVIQCNPKPEHKAFRDVANGFYGEYLERAPGTDDTVSLFCNASNETVCDGLSGEGLFGRSSVLLHARHKVKPAVLPEYVSDDYGGLPVCRLRFGAGTRLYYYSLPFFHEADPRTTRTPVKIHAIFRRSEDGWQRIPVTGQTDVMDV